METHETKVVRVSTGSNTGQRTHETKSYVQVNVGSDNNDELLLLPPIRCFTCGKPVDSKLWLAVQASVAQLPREKWKKYKMCCRLVYMPAS